MTTFLISLVVLWVLAGFGGWLYEVRKSGSIEVNDLGWLVIYIVVAPVPAYLFWEELGIGSKTIYRFSPRT